MIRTLDRNPNNLERMRREWAKLANGLLASAVGVNRTVGDPKTGTAIVPLSDGHIVPQQSLTPGKLLQVRGYGTYSTAGDTLTFQLYAGDTLLIDTGAITLDSILAGTNKAWVLRAQIHTLTTGGEGLGDGTVTAFLESLSLDGMIVASLPGATIDLDTFSQHAVHLRIAWGSSDSGNSVTEQILSVTDAGV